MKRPWYFKDLAFYIIVSTLSSCMGMTFVMLHIFLTMLRDGGVVLLEPNLFILYMEIIMCVVLVITQVLGVIIIYLRHTFFDGGD